ncbi:UDP-N-acetylmuramoyl-tripeptide--D-alanyl-D-alanine ligase [Gephyromycinifex aptenodytis]|uniref:UDP-N-acetylmuramoyl-tripeptide--D-alanyl-D- alanine ligase n=1 Tax=Gephyromycinifex aptenodytis TaxID=2716227 RepID=UPI001446F335|nr:UDP-N-acetylmuramoyl-tripeptide--D-alanyl-D-alanine ligase [Gephyromycinifex aptenodytis]
MIPLSLGRIAQITGGELHGDPQVCIDGPVVTDSRAAQPGSLYVARVGEHADGHEYVPGAAAAGAVAALSTRVVEALPCVVVPDVQAAFAALASAVIEQVEDLVVIGITGSSGKTTTKDLLAGVLSTLGETVANEGSLNSEVGVPLTVTRITPTTRYLIVEMGARGIGHIDYLAKMTSPHIGIVLNVGSAHLGEFGSREAIARAKGELVEALPADGLAILQADDPLVAGMAERTTAQVCTVGRLGGQLQALKVEVGPSGAASFTLAAGEQRERVTLELLGEHQVDNALAVAACALHLGMSLPQLAAALAQARPVSRWRMERHDRADGVVVINDAYNANPESMAAALRTLKRMAEGKRTWAVLGTMLELGPTSDEEHRQIGEMTADLGIDEVLAVGQGAAAIAEGVRIAGQRRSVRTHAQWVSDIDAAQRVLDENLRKGDVVVLKSSRDAGLRQLGDRLVGQETLA